MEIPHEPTNARRLRRTTAPSQVLLTAAVVLGMLGGLSIAALLALINKTLHASEGLNQDVVLAFAPRAIADGKPSAGRQQRR